MNNEFSTVYLFIYFNYIFLYFYFLGFLRLLHIASFRSSRLTQPVFFLLLTLDFFYDFYCFFF